MIKRFIIFVFILSAASAAYWFWQSESILYLSKKLPASSPPSTIPATKPKPKEKTRLTATIDIATLAKSEPTDFPPQEIPQEVKAVYVTAQTAGVPSLINNLIDLIENTELNSLVINIKDGNKAYFSQWMINLIKRLREKGIYPIARIVVFKDDALAKQRPDLALKTKDGELWGKQGYRWVDPSSQEVWDRNANVAIAALNIGFLEVNFDYIRFPDGDVNEIVYPFYDYSKLKMAVISEASEYMNAKIKEKHPKAITSIDIFAYSFLRTHGLGIGQRLVDLADHFDVIAPMIYPSHYGPGNFGFDNPAEEPYQVVLQTLQSGNWQLLQAEKKVVIRPWIQDFNMGAIYNKEMVQAEIQATKDAFDKNYAGFMSWNPNNVYNLNKYQNTSQTP